GRPSPQAPSTFAVGCGAKTARATGAMLALEEKVRSVVLLLPELVLTGKASEVVAKFEQSFLEVKARKLVYLSEAEAESYFHYLQKDARKSVVAAATRGLTEVLVLEHLDGDVVEISLKLLEELHPTCGAGNIYCSQDRWECLHDIEFFFPHLDSLPVDRTLAVLKPAAMERGALEGRTIEQLVEDEAAAVGLFVVGKRNLVMSQEEATVLCQDFAGTADHAGAIGVLCQEPGCVAMCLEGRGAIGKLQLICGPPHSGTARDRAPTTIRANWGTDSTSNAIHASASMEASDKEMKAIFPEGTLTLQRTLCVVKPDGVSHLVAIKAEIEAAGFTVLKEKQVTLTEERAAEFYKDQQGKPSFSALMKEACSGPCCALVLCRLEAVAVWKQLMGDPSVKEARKTRPGSLRARFGRDGQRNAVYGSESVKGSARDIRFFFPEMGADPIPNEDEVRDFLFRKSAGASMDLKTLEDADVSNFAVDPTMQQLLSKGLMALCQVKPKGLGAATFLSKWLADNNPNNAVPEEKTGHGFEPPERTKKFVEYGVNSDGMAFAVEAPREEEIVKPVVEVDTTEGGDTRPQELSTPPFVVFVAGGPGSGKATQC
ncbi:unnamed protein product, partial [Polarella glacialis]